MPPPPQPPAVMDRNPQRIEETPEHASQLEMLVHTYLELQKKGYILEQLTREDLDKKRRCAQCSKMIPPEVLRKLKLNGPPQAAVIAVEGVERDRDPGEVDDDGPGQGGALLIPPEQENNGSQGFQKQRRGHRTDECIFHPGRVGRDRQWSCCGGHPMSKPCQQADKHVPVVYNRGELEANWRFQATPARTSRHKNNPPLIAVAVDCEMGTAESGETELIRISMIDYFTGAVLLDKLVWPDVQMAHFNTRFSGVTRQAMNQARRNRTCLFGRHGARRAIWDHVGPNTVVIGHSLNSDLTSLRWIHPRVIDTLMVEDPFAQEERRKIQQEHALACMAAEEDNLPVPVARASQHPGLSLKALTKAYLRRDIQLRGQGHDSLEDATATRDLLHWHVVNRMPAPNTSTS